MAYAKRTDDIVETQTIIIKKGGIDLALTFEEARFVKELIGKCFTSELTQHVYDALSNVDNGYTADYEFTTNENEYLPMIYVEKK